MSNPILESFNAHYNLEICGLPHGTPISMEELEAITLEVAAKVLPSEEGKIAVADLLSLAEELQAQGVKSLKEIDSIGE